MRLFKTWWYLFTSYWRQRASYPLDFFIGLLGITAIEGLSLLILWIIIEQFQAFGPELRGLVFLTYALGTVAYAYYRLIFLSVTRLPAMIRDGRLDRYLTLPVPPLFGVITSQFSASGYMTLIVGHLLAALALAAADIPLSVGLLLALEAWALLAAAFLGALFLSGSCTCFWLTDLGSLQLVIVRFISVNRYPFDIFPDFVRNLFTYFIPLIVVAYLPAQIVMAEVPPLLVAYTLLLTVALVAAALVLWKLGLRQYQGAGG